MNAALVTIGSELLSGFTLDTNATWIGRKLLDIGIQTVWKGSVPDQHEAVLDAFRLAKQKAGVVICTGGLGPTSDDITKRSFCEFIGARLVLDETYLEKLSAAFARRGMAMPPSNRDQAMIPDRGEPIPNPVGSALGIRFTGEECRFYLLPGVPLEMKRMMEETVLPELAGLQVTPLRVINLRTAGIAESALYDLVKDLTGASEDVDVAFLPGFTGVDLRLSGRDGDAVELLGADLRTRLGTILYAEGWRSLEEVVGERLRQLGQTIAVAESCTGGLVADRLTNVPGSSDYFLGAAVCYSNYSKTSLLGVQASTLQEYGAVSAETAGEMARGVRSLFSADVGIATTGIAGPSGGTTEKPVGLHFICVDVRGTTTTKDFRFSTDRRFNKELGSQAALNILRTSLP